MQKWIGNTVESESNNGDSCFLRQFFICFCIFGEKGEGSKKKMLLIYTQASSDWKYMVFNATFEINDFTCGHRRKPACWSWDILSLIIEKLMFFELRRMNQIVEGYGEGYLHKLRRGLQTDNFSTLCEILSLAFMKKGSYFDWAALELMFDTYLG